MQENKSIERKKKGKGRKESVMEERKERILRKRYRGERNGIN